MVSPTDKLQPQRGTSSCLKKNTTKCYLSPNLIHSRHLFSRIKFLFIRLRYVHCVYHAESMYLVIGHVCIHVRVVWM